MHKSRRTVHNGPSTPPRPSLELMVSSEVCNFLRAVREAAKAQDTVNIWQPGSAPTTAVKRLQPKKKEFPKDPKEVAGPKAGTVVESPEAEAVPVAEVAAAAEVVPVAEAAIRAEAAQAVGQRY